MYTQDYFKNKKITVMGLGLLGRGVGDIKFLAEEGAELIVTDLKSEIELKASVDALKAFPTITFMLGEHRLEDFQNRDFILKAAGVPLDSIYIEEARKNNIPIEMSASLFAALTPATLIGITGTRGKSTVTHLLYDVLKEAYKEKFVRIFLGGNVKGVSTLSFLREAKKGDIAVLELDSWQLQGFGERKISPHIAVFTNFLNDHLNYYKGDMEKYFDDKANIFLYQKQNDYLITGPTVGHLITAKHFQNLAQHPIALSGEIVPKDWSVQLSGQHNLDNIALVIRVANIVGVPYEVTRKVVEEFKGVPGRLELIREYKGIKIYNDTTATTPDATIVALKALETNIILIAGGADKQLDMSKLVEEIPKHTKAVVWLAGTGTEKIKGDALVYDTLKKAVDKAFEIAQPGDSVLLSPAFASYGMFINEFDRGDQFVKIVESLPS
ncbi:MAG: UDP-N-acetylmuramoyl-L-alanine--D-glutamate ligase [bacterium]|nr:UDP-N-acetylmuramoyl-L-alanine--D-glutamate ligase [bacterium]